MKRISAYLLIVMNILLTTTNSNAMPKNFKINDLVWYEDFAPLGKNAKLPPKWQGLAKITEINDTNS